MTGFIKPTTETINPIVPRDFRHALCTGMTGCGKTSSFILPNIRTRIQNGHGIFAIDYKGNLGAQIKAVAHKEERLEDVIEIGVTWGNKINILSHVNKALLSDVIDIIDGKNQEGDRFWINSAISLAGLIYEILKISHHAISLSRTFMEFDDFLPHFPKSYLHIINSLKNLKDFIRSLKKMTSRLRGVHIYRNEVDKTILRLINQYRNLLEDHIETLEAFIDAYDEDRPGSGNGGIALVLRSNLMSLNEICMNGDADLLDLLDSKKIVILRSDSLHENLTKALMYILFTRLSRRVDTKTPISLFIDEFQRAIAKDRVPHVDVFREKRVELIAAVQNQNQLENLLGENESRELMGNIIHNYEFANHQENSLDTFEYIYNKSKSKATPIFVPDRALDAVQHKWQHYHDLGIQKGWIIEKSIDEFTLQIRHIKTHEQKIHYVLFKEDSEFENSLHHISKEFPTYEEECLDEFEDEKPVF